MTLIVAMIFEESSQKSQNTTVELEIEYLSKILLFSVEPISEGLEIVYPAERPVQLIPEAIQSDMFTTLPPHSSREFRLQLPHMVQTKVPPATVFSEEYFPLPVGRYHVQLTYYNHDIGYQMKVGEERRYVDLNAWVGKIEGEPAVLTITSGK